MGNINNHDAEAMLLSILLNYPENLALIPEIKAEMFADMQHRQIFDAIKKQDDFDPTSLILEHANQKISIKILIRDFMR